MTWSGRDCCPEPGHELTAESLKEDISLIMMFDERSGALVLEVCSPD